jgi:hypothetical protein
MKELSRSRKLTIAGAALVLGGFGAGAAVAVTGSATASDSSTNGSSRSGDGFDPSKSIRPDEKLLTGTTADKVQAAALAEYPDATIQRVETDSDGVYEAHIVTTDGQELIVQVGKDFAVTGAQDFGGHGPADHDGDGDGSDDDGPTQSGSNA